MGKQVSASRCDTASPCSSEGARKLSVSPVIAKPAGHAGAGRSSVEVTRVGIRPGCHVELPNSGDPGRIPSDPPIERQTFVDAGKARRQHGEIACKSNPPSRYVRHAAETSKPGVSRRIALPRLELEPQTELHDPWRAGTGNSPGIAGIDVVARVQQVGVIEGVEHLPAELQRRVFRDLELLEECKV